MKCYYRNQMKSILFSILIALFTLPVFAQQQAQAKAVLDKTATLFNTAGGVKASFSVQVSSKGRLLGETTGVIQLKGDKFLFKTADVITWFDGTTQWSYLTESEEVNVSNPTPAELQRMNPYALLSLYHKGYSYKMGSAKQYRGKSVDEVILTATNKKEDLSRIALYVTKEGQPVGIIVESRNGDKSEIVVTSYQSGQKYADAVFVFNKKQYPRAEVIDLR